MGRTNFPTAVFLNINLGDASAVVWPSRLSFRLLLALLIDVGDSRLSFNQHDALDMITSALGTLKGLPG